MTVRARLALQFVALTTAILGLFSVSLYAWVRNSLDADLEQELATEYRSFEHYFFEEYSEIQRGQPNDLEAEIRGYMSARGMLGEVRGPEGSPLYASEGFSSRIHGDHVHTKVAGVHYRGAVGRALQVPGQEFTLIVAISEDGYRHALHQLRLYFLIFCPLVLLLAWWIGHAFVGRALAPVEAMRRQAERISRESLSDRLPEPTSRGEFLNLARTFNEMLDRLSRAFQDLENFAADAAHELRTPLANLRAEIETAVQQPRTPEEYEAVLGSLAEEVSRMTRVVTNLFTLARIDMRQYELQRESVALAPLLEEARETWEGAADSRRISIRVGEVPTDATVSGDPVALRRVVMNLVENAVKYNREGGRVILSAQRENGCVRLRIEDTGIGIPADHLPRLFQRFYRVDPGRSRESGGAGLGLAICKSLVEAHGGKVEVKSAFGEGTTFTVELPGV